MASLQAVGQGVAVAAMNLAFWGPLAYFRVVKPMRKRRAAKPSLPPGRSASCEWAVVAAEAGRCHRAEVNRLAGGETGGCGNCDRGRPRWITGAELARSQAMVRDGWIKPDGSPCDLDVYQEAFGRSTPAEVLRRRAEAARTEAPKG